MEHITQVTPDNKDFTIIREHALKFLRGKDMLPLITQSAIKEVRDYVNSEFIKLLAKVTGVSFVDNYVSCERVRAEYEATNIIPVSKLNNVSKLFPDELNLRFRAVHDYIHITNDFPCDYSGELANYEAHCKGINQDVTLSKTAKAILYSEIVLQACFALYYGHFPNVQKIVL